MTTAINVNLSGGDVVLVPCPIPRSVTFSVAPGSCTTGCDFGGTRSMHYPHCPARPVKVSCSISGKTWEESEVDEQEYLNTRPLATDDLNRLYAACRDRWALVKALVTGFVGDFGALCPGSAAVVSLRNQRDAVFAALAAMARAERAAHAAFLALPMDIRKSSILAKAMGHVATDPLAARLPSVTLLEHYVEHLIERVGIPS
jgi:hypothetical protein